ncbi:MAG: (S)-ureidoglycine aminohydrolase [Rhodobacteraceae bacterium]|nr:(S)-ureidoglycine aminohydrolase [Paracoccaceae bacterium]
MTSYPDTPGGLPPQSTQHTGRAVFKTAYAVIPKGVMRDIVTSNLPGWTGTRSWILARPLSGFAETFSYYVVEVAPGGGSTSPEPDPTAGAVVFVTAGSPTLTVNGAAHSLEPGSYVYLPPEAAWQLENTATSPATFHWIRKAYETVEGIEAPSAFVTHDRDVAAQAMPDTDGVWATQRFVDPDDVSHDFHVNIVNFAPGGRIPFEETHVMEHGIFILEGQASYLLNEDWVEVEAGDFLWLRAFCPQACVARGDRPFRYLLYKDVNRHAKLR